MQTLLNVNNLSVNFDTTQGIFTAVDDVSFYINNSVVFKSKIPKYFISS